MNRPPIKLSLDDYMNIWKPQGWDILVSDRHSNYRPEWGVWEGIRDIVQNALDEDEHYQWGYDANGMWIKDNGGGVLIRNFLMGGGESKPPYMRGKFGEGMKIAALALLREGYQVHIMSKGVELWSIMYPQRIQQRPPMYEDTICFLWRENGSMRGTTWHIHGYTGDDFRYNFVQNLPRMLILAETASKVDRPVQRYNLLLRREGGARGERYDNDTFYGRIYCRDIWLKDIMSPFSYNLWGFEVAPDRHGPKHESEMYTDMGRLWMGVANPALLTMLMKMLSDPPIEVGGWKITDEAREMNFDPRSTDPHSKKMYSELMVQSKSQWNTAWKNVHGQFAVLRTESRYDGMVKHLGYTSAEVNYRARNALQLVIKTDRNLMDEMADRLSETQRTPDSALTERQLANLQLARAIADMYPQAGPVYAAVIPPPSDAMERTAGLYEFGTGIIKIHVDQLQHTGQTVAVVIHELGHHQAYANVGFDPDRQEKAYDLTPLHTRSMEEVSADVTDGIIGGRFDKQLKNVPPW